MKLSGMAGTGSGKLGSNVYASVAGEQVVRNYQPNVSNPNTALQVNQRARMKLLSQLSAVYSPVLAFKKKGMTSARNLFVKKNFALSSGNDGQAQLTIENIQLTSGTAGLPGIRASRNGALTLMLQLQADARMIVDRVVYVLFKKTGQNQLQLVDSRVVTEAGEAGNFPTSLAAVRTDYVIYAYGMKDLNSRATASYGDYSVLTGEDIAKLFMSRKLDFNSYRFTKTRGCQIYADEENAASVGPNQARIFVTASGAGSVAGAGVYQRGTTVQLSATPAEGSEFIGWMENGGNRFLSYSPTLQVETSQLVDLVAIFQTQNSETGGYNGHEYVNPLPTAPVIDIDGTEYELNDGQLNLTNSFDNLGISNVGDDVTITVVPHGSFLGADDNVTLGAGTTAADPDWSATFTGMESCAIYIDGEIWFYINTPEQQPWLNANVSIDGDSVTIENGKVQVTEETVETISIQRSTDNYNITVQQADGRTRNFVKGVGEYVIADVLVPATVYVNGFKWFDIEVREEPALAITSVKIDGETYIPGQSYSTLPDWSAKSFEATFNNVVSGSEAQVNGIFYNGEEDIETHFSDPNSVSISGNKVSQNMLGVDWGRALNNALKQIIVKIDGVNYVANFPIA